MFFKRFLAFVLVLTMLCANFAFAQDSGLLISPAPAAGQAELSPTQEELNKQATGFYDITADAPYAAAVKKLVEYGIIAGYPDGTFKPEGEVTRAEMTKMINLTLGFVEFEGAAGFPDVTTSNWYYTYALAAQKQGYVKGYEDMTFRGSNNITRQEMCAILDRLLKPMNLGFPVTITDAVSNWARPHVELIVQNFIMPLEANNTFRATENLKRHELATVLSNMAIGPVKQIDADVRFFVNGEQYGETQTVIVGNCATVPEAPAAPSSSYVFDGWRPIGTQDVVDVASLIVIADVDYEAVFAKKLHDVTFYSRDSVYYTYVAEHGNVAQAPKNPEVKGYEFLGWSLEKDGKTVKLSETKIYENTTFYAVFAKEEGAAGGGGGGGGDEEEVEFTVKFFVNGDLFDSQKVEKNFSPTNPGTPELEGYTFLGWSLEENDANEIVSLTSLRITKKLTLYAIFEKDAEEEPEVYTVTFFVDNKVYDTQYVEEGKNPVSVSNPTKDGYIFKHWSKTEGGREVKVTQYSVTENTSFYAVFEEKKEDEKTFVVTFVVDGETYDEAEVVEGQKASAPITPRKDGYEFKGWSRTAGGSVSSVSSVTVNSDITFYAVFEKIEHTVTFVVDGNTHDTQTVGDKETAILPDAPEKEGFTFKGWAERDGGNVVTVTNITITSNKTFYAVFEKKEAEKKYFVIKFVVDGKTYDSFEVLEGEEIEHPEEPTKENHEFLGWALTEGGSVTSVSDKATKDETYYAVFKEIKKYTVTFYVNGKVFFTDTVVEEETVSSVKTPSVEGYKFLGWSDTEGGEVVSVSSYEITQNTDFYAVLEEIEPEKEYFSVTFKVDGKNYDTVQTVEDGDYATEPRNDPEKGGYTFEGWSLSKDGEMVDVESVKITEDTVFHAIFSKNPVYYEVIFMVEDEEVDVQEVLEGEYPRVPHNPVVEGFEFLGWSKTEGGTTVNPDKTPVKSDIIYYAVFEEAEEEIIYHKVIFWFDGDPFLSYEVAEGDSASEPEIPELKEGVLFFGWALELTRDKEEAIDIEDYVIEEPTDFYAILVENPNDDEFMEKITRGHKQLKEIKRLTGLTKDAVKIITNCIGYVIDDANAGVLITKNYITSEYGSMVDDVKDKVNNQMSGQERSQFVNLLTDTDNIDEDVQDFLIDYFDIDMSI